MRKKATWEWEACTLSDRVLDATLLGTLLAASLALLAKFGQNEGSHAFDDTR